LYAILIIETHHIPFDYSLGYFRKGVEQFFNAEIEYVQIIGKYKFIESANISKMIIL